MPEGSELAPVRRVPRVTPPPTTAPDQGHFPWTVIGVMLLALVVCLYMWRWLINGQPYSAALILIPLLVLFTAPTMLRAARSESDFDIAGLILVGLGLRFGLAYYRFIHAADAQIYHNFGVYLAREYRHFNFGADSGSQVPGTGGLRIVSGVVHVFVNDDFFASFLVMAWLGFWGCWFLYRAAVITVPDLKRYRYARLLFLWPSLAFWPSSIGKDSWMLFTIGLASLGAAKVFQRHTGGYTILFGGLFLGSFVRPHLALVAVVAFGVALLIGRRSNVTDRLTPSSIGKLAALVVLLAVGSILITQTEKLLDVNDLNSTTIESSFNDFRDQTAEGESTFNAPDPLSPTGFPQAVVTVLFRPFPTEAHGLEQLVTATEGLFLVALTLTSLRGILSIFRRLRSQPYVTYAAIYVLLWAMVFGIISNFGILTRQRSQMLPFFFLLISLPALASLGPAERRRKALTRE
jgi:hypothetical protein